MSDRNVGYIQFPLCSLAFGTDQKERLECIISYGLVQAGVAMYEKFEQEVIEAKTWKFKNGSDTPTDFDPENWLHVAIMIASVPMGINPGSIETVLRRRNCFVPFLSQFESKYGRDAKVRIKKDWVFEVRDGTGITYREFSTLCAVYSCIGAYKVPIRITKGTIQFRMCGYKSRKVFVSENPALQILSERQIGYTLNSLHARGFFARVSPNRRQNYFSHRLTVEEMSDYLFKTKTAAARSANQSRLGDVMLREKIRIERARLSRSGSLFPPRPILAKR